MSFRSSIDQWRVLAAVVDQGGFAQAAAHLHRSQSAVSYALARLQQDLGVTLLETQGRRSVLTPAGEALLRRARVVLEQFGRLESLARSMDAGWEAELRLVVDAAFPQPLLLDILRDLRRGCPDTTIALADAVLSGAEDAIVQGLGDVVVTTRVPPSFSGDWLMNVRMLAVAAPSHALHQLQRVLTPEDLTPHTQVVVRDSGQVKRDEGWLGASHRWTVASLEVSRATVLAGMAYAWLPVHLVRDDIDAGRLRPLPLSVGATRQMPLYVVAVKGEAAGPAARQAVASFRAAAEAAVAHSGPHH